MNRYRVTLTERNTETYLVEAESEEAAEDVVHTHVDMGLRDDLTSGDDGGDGCDDLNISAEPIEVVLCGGGLVIREV